MMKTVALYTMGVFYILAGIFHFVKPSFYIRIMPTWLPWHRQIVYISGLCEIMAGVLLFPPATRNLAAWGVIVLLIVIFPANIRMMFIYRRRKSPYRWITVLRLPLQLLLIWWAWLYTA